MTTFQGMMTFESRLASFSKAPTKKRASNAKGTKTIKWPHTNPTPETLARAGFVFKPSASTPDNVECFLCHKDLEGWEADDDPLTEHVAHSPDCAFAIHIQLENSVPADHDPTSAYMVSARTTTLNSWPHTKRGWKCKSDAMAAAGFYFCPTKASSDFAKCVYCGLGLDGWTAKDDPVHEHRTKAPKCAFILQNRSRPATPRSSPGYMASTLASRARSNSDASTTSVDEKSVVLHSPRPQSPRPQSPLPSAGWYLADYERFLESIGVPSSVGVGSSLTEEEKERTMRNWIEWRAEEEAATLQRECEERVAYFEREAARAIEALERLPTSD